MLTLFDNNTLMGLAIRTRLDRISCAIDSIDVVPRLSAGHAHTPEHLLTTSSTASPYASNGIGCTEVTLWK